MGQVVLSIGYGGRVISGDGMEAFDAYFEKNNSSNEVDELSTSEDEPGDLLFFVVSEEPGTVRLGEVGSVCNKQITRAKRNWEKFRKFAEKRGVVVGEGELWLVPNEVA